MIKNVVRRGFEAGLITIDGTRIRPIHTWFVARVNTDEIKLRKRFRRTMA